MAFAIPILARRTSRKRAHAICLACGALGLLSILLLEDPRWDGYSGVGGTVRNGGVSLTTGSGLVLLGERR